MVRLLRAGLAVRWRCPKLFQSHNGAIAAFYHQVLVRRVSIPQWCDCCELRAELGALRRLVSIPQWCDCCTTTRDGYLVYDEVSIPQWCDCCCRCLTASCCHRTKFQSHNGAIAAHCCGWKHFNFKCVSIPQWCDCCLKKLKKSSGKKSCFNPTMVRLLRT